MNNLIKLTPTILLALLLSGCQTQQQKLEESGLAPLNAMELAALIVPGTRTEFTTGTLSGSLAYREGGSVEGQWGGATHLGSWRLDGNRYCSRWEDRQERCFMVFETAPNRYVSILPDGSQAGSFSLK